jgi:regulator of cell morphogenesis and NO signaling
MNEPATGLEPPIDTRQTLAEVATRFPGAARVFQRHGLDFCCHGQVPVAQACALRGLDARHVVEELRRESQPAPPAERWDQKPVPELIDHLLHHYHDRHRAELTRLTALAGHVERVHRDKPACPRGLAAQLQFTSRELENHMHKEESVLFPMLRAGHGPHAGGPIQVMESEHLEHGRNLEALRRICHGFEPPPDACGSWRELYRGLAAFERELMQHIHLENYVLFPRVLALGAVHPQETER